jgi:hypothetical protein
MLQTISQKVKVIVPLDYKQGIIPQIKEGQHISLGVTIFADGTHLDTLVILPLKTLPESLESLHEGYTFSGQESGWITAEIFQQYCQKIIIKAYQSRIQKIHTINPNARGLLILDSHTSRSNSSLLEEFQKNNIDVLTLPSHTSHILQPLDRGIFKIFKATLSRKRINLVIEDADTQRFELLRLAKHALYNAFYPENIKKAFAEAGIFPINRQHILDSDVVGDAPQIKKRTRTHKAVQIDGRVITTDELINQLKMQEENKLHKKSKRNTTSNV